MKKICLLIALMFALQAPVMAQGVFAVGEVVTLDCNSFSPTTGSFANADSTPTYKIFEEDNDTAILSGNMTLRTATTGQYRATVTMSSGNGVEAGKWYIGKCYITTGGVSGGDVPFYARAWATETVAGVPPVDTSYILGVGVSSSLAQIGTNVVTYATGRTPLQPTVAGRTIDISATGGAGVDWANVESPTTANALTGTTFATSQVVASVTGAVGSVTGAVGSISAGGIPATAFAADAITSATLAASVANEIADQVWDELTAGHVIAGSTGKALTDASALANPWSEQLPGAFVAGSAGYIIGNQLLRSTVNNRTLDVSATGEAGIDWANVGSPTTAVAFTNTTHSTSQIVASVTGAVGSVTGAVGSVTGAVGSVTGAVGSVTGTTGGMTAAGWLGAFTANTTGTYAAAHANSVVKQIADNSVSSGLTLGAIADSVWDEAISGHLTSGTTGNKLNSAAAAGDPLNIDVPGSYGPGTVGYLIGTYMPNLDTTVSSRASYSVQRAVAKEWGMKFVNSRGNAVTSGTPTCTRSIDSVNNFSAVTGVAASPVTSGGRSEVTLGTADTDGASYVWLLCTLPNAQPYEQEFSIQQ